MTFCPIILFDVNTLFGTKGKVVGALTLVLISGTYWTSCSEGPGNILIDGYLAELKVNYSQTRT